MILQRITKRKYLPIIIPMILDSVSPKTIRHYSCSKRNFPKVTNTKTVQINAITDNPNSAADITNKFMQSFISKIFHKNILTVKITEKKVKDRTKYLEIR
jgi:capsular polysaccharide biosynthesis protein